MSGHDNWNQCEEIARHYDEETGREVVLTCDLGRHEAPGENEEHHDPRLLVFWKRDDEGPRFDE